MLTEFAGLLQITSMCHVDGSDTHENVKIPTVCNVPAVCPSDDLCISDRDCPQPSAPCVVNQCQEHGKCELVTLTGGEDCGPGSCDDGASPTCNLDGECGVYLKFLHVSVPTTCFACCRCAYNLLCCQLVVRTMIRCARLHPRSSSP